jgi:signal transduction histidine kinase
MKSPLYAIQLEAEKLDMLLRNDRSHKLPAQSKSIPSSIIQDVDQLNSQIQFMMKFLSFKFQTRKSVDIHELINKVVMKYAELYKGRVHFEPKLDNETIRLNIDSTQIETALSNLMQNAVEAISENGKVTVSSLIRHSPILRTPKGIDIEVIDNGIGIPEKSVKDVFKPYFSTKPQGTGIGLTITKKIIEAHGGKIEVQSKEGIGTRFAVFLPWKDRLWKVG